jgi:hypothetical protein
MEPFLYHIFVQVLYLQESREGSRQAKTSGGILGVFGIHFRKEPATMGDKNPKKPPKSKKPKEKAPPPGPAKK